MYGFRPNLRKISLWGLLLIQILLILSYFYLQSRDSAGALRRISFVPGNEVKRVENLAYHTLDSQINLKRITTKEYFINFNSSMCFTGGTDIKSMRVSKEPNWHCNCLSGWHGNDCGYPEVLLRALLAYKKPVKLKGPRKFQRRIIYVFEFDKLNEHLTDIRINEFGDIVDLFVIYEPNGSSLKTKLHGNFCKTLQHKILYIQENTYNLWKVIKYQVKNLREDDIIFTSSSTEIPNKDALIFLKFYDDFPEPIAFRLRWSVYGFFWTHPTKTIISGRACTVAYLSENFNDQLELLSSDKSSPNFSQKGIILGDLNHTGGWYCEFCATTEEIIEYLANRSRHSVNWNKISAAKIDSKYIENLIENGLYIDGKLELERAHRYSDNNFAPKYVLDNDWKFDFLLINFYSQGDYYA